MKIILIYTEDEYIQVLRLTPQEENIMINPEDIVTTMDERVMEILDKRGVNYTDFDPIWMVTDTNVGIFDEGDEQPVFVI